jgi:hypothetical protein
MNNSLILFLVKRVILKILNHHFNITVNDLKKIALTGLMRTMKLMNFSTI